MEDIADQEKYEKAVDTYGQFVGDEVCLPDELGSTMMDRFTNHVKHNKDKPKEIQHPILFADNSLYQVSFPNS